MVLFDPPRRPQGDVLREGLSLRSSVYNEGSSDGRGSTGSSRQAGCCPCSHLTNVMIAYEIRGVEPSDEEQLLRGRAPPRHGEPARRPRGDPRDRRSVAARASPAQIKDPKKREYVFVLVDRAKETDRRHLDDHRPARPARRAVHLLRRHRRGEVLADDRQALPPHGACASATRTTGPPRSAGSSCCPSTARRPSASGTMISVRALPLHRRAPRALPRRGARRAPAAARARRDEPPLGGARPPLHRADATPRPTCSRRRTRSSSRASFPTASSTRSLLPQDGAGRHRQGGRADARRGEAPAAHRLPLRGPRRPVRRRPALHRAHRRDHAGAATRRARVAEFSPPSPRGNKGLVALELAASPFWRVVLADVRDLGERGVAVEAEAAEHLGVGVGDEVVTLPLD